MRQTMLQYWLFSHQFGSDDHRLAADDELTKLMTSTSIDTVPGIHCQLSATGSARLYSYSHRHSRPTINHGNRQSKRRRHLAHVGNAILLVLLDLCRFRRICSANDLACFGNVLGFDMIKGWWIFVFYFQFNAALFNSKFKCIWIDEWFHVYFHFRIFLQTIFPRLNT